MANPFLTIGAVAVGVVTAGIGILQVPGWIDSANDSAVRNDLSQIAIGQEAAYTVGGSYTNLAGLEAGTVTDNSGSVVQTGVNVQVSAGLKPALATGADEWASVIVSKSGHVFVRTSDSAEIYTDDSKDYTKAIAAINDDLNGVTVGGTKTAPTVTLG